jgi:thioredoxin 1
MEPVLERLEAENEPPMKVVMLDVDNSPATASRFGVRGVPTFILFRDGAEVSRMVGAMPEPAFRARLRENLAESAA